MPWLFSYGTLQQPGVQRATFGRLLPGRHDALVGYAAGKVVIDDAAVVATSGMAEHPIVRHTGRDADRVPGMVFEVSELELAHADRYEVSAYRRMATVLASGLQAWVYVAAEDVESPG